MQTRNSSCFTNFSEKYEKSERRTKFPQVFFLKTVLRPFTKPSACPYLPYLAWHPVSGSVISQRGVAFGRICNPAALNISICNAIIGLKILIFRASGLQITSGRKNFLYIFKNSKYFTLSAFAQAFSLFRRQFFLAAYAYEGNHSRTHSISHSLTFSRTPLLEFYKINYFQNKNNL